MLALGFTCLVLGAVALMEPSRQAQSRRVSATASRATTWNSQDICLLMDHEPLWPEECRTLLRADHLKQLVRGDLRTLNAQEQLQKLENEHETAVEKLKEFELLEVLMRNAGRVLTRGQLIDRVWGTDYFGDTKTLDVHIKRIRSRIEQSPSDPTMLVTVRGLGYRFEA